MRRGLPGVLFVLCFALGCAPRNSRTHFDRWADETQKRHAKEADEKKQAQAAKPAEAKPAPASETPATSKPASPEVKRAETATRSRSVVQPSDTADKKTADDDAIY